MLLKREEAAQKKERDDNSTSKVSIIVRQQQYFGVVSFGFVLMGIIGGRDDSHRRLRNDLQLHRPQTFPKTTLESEIHPHQIPETKMGGLESDWIYAKRQL